MKTTRQNIEGAFAHLTRALSEAGIDVSKWSLEQRSVPGNPYTWTVMRNDGVYAFGYDQYYTAAGIVSAMHMAADAVYLVTHKDA
jgi:hypothetical protein